MKAITTEDFDRLLGEVINDENVPASQLLSVPGVYEILAEYYNNDVLDAWKAEQEESTEEESTED